MKAICSTSLPFFHELFNELRDREVLLKSKTRKWPAGDVSSYSNYMNSLEAARYCYCNSNLRHSESQFFKTKHKEILFGRAEKEYRNISEATLILKRRANPIVNWKPKCWNNWKQASIPKAKTDRKANFYTSTTQIKMNSISKALMMNTLSLHRLGKVH